MMTDPAVMPVAARDRARWWARALTRLTLDERAARMRRSLLGRWGAVLLPLVESLAFTAVFGILLKVRGAPAGYLPFAYIGLLAWRVFARGLLSAAGALPRNGPLLHGFRVPVAVVAGAALGGALYDGLLGLPVLLAIVVATGGVPDAAALAAWLPVGLALQLAAMLGAGLALAVANALYRDVGFALGPLLALLMFAAPVVYPATLVPEAMRAAFLANPMSAAIECYRAALLGGAPVPSASLTVATAIALGLALAGVGLAARLDGRVREVL